MRFSLFCFQTIAGGSSKPRHPTEASVQYRSTTIQPIVGIPNEAQHQFHVVITPREMDACDMFYLSSAGLIVEGAWYTIDYYGMWYMYTVMWGLGPIDEGGETCCHKMWESTTVDIIFHSKCRSWSGAILNWLGLLTEAFFVFFGLIFVHSVFLLRKDSVVKFFFKGFFIENWKMM